MRVIIRRSRVMKYQEFWGFRDCYLPMELNIWDNLIPETLSRQDQTPCHRWVGGVWHFGHATIREGFATVSGMLKPYMALWRNLKCVSLHSSQRTWFLIFDQPPKIAFSGSGTFNIDSQDLKAFVEEAFTKKKKSQISIQVGNPIFPRWGLKYIVKWVSHSLPWQIPQAQPTEW